MDFNTKPTIKDNQATITFDDLSLSAYEDFIKVRQLAKYEIKGNVATFPASYIDDFWQENKELPLPLAPSLFDYQEVMVQVGFLKQRYAFFADAGLGKSYVLGELGKQLYAFTKNRIVYCVPLNILKQFEEMMEFFKADLFVDTDFDGFDPEYLNFPTFDHLHNSKMSLNEWCHYGDNRVAFVNQEAFIRHDKPLKNVDTFLLDESSILKGGRDGNGKIAKNIIKATQGIKFKYAASATPSPNDRVEYAMHALYLEDVKSEKEFTSLFFVNKDGQYVLRKHAHEAFYKRLALWSIFIRNPANYGFDDNLAGLKPWKEIHKRIEITPEQDELIRQYATKGKQKMLPGMAIKPTSMKQRGKFSQISKGFVYEKGVVRCRVKTNKPDEIAMTLNEYRGEQFIIATVFDEEGEILHERLLQEGFNVVHITGKTNIEERARLLNEFRQGKIDGVISKPRIIGFGLNLQFCRIAIVSGLSDSYELLYQFIKRVHRYGQDSQVLIFFFYTEYEEVILSNVLKKKDVADRDFAYQEKMYIDSLFDELKEFLTMEDYKPLVKERIMYKPVRTDNYTMHHADSLKMMLEIAEGKKVYEELHKNSVDFSVFSPPFMADLFTYSDDPADMGNTRGLGAKGGLDEFMLQFRFFLKGMMHVTKPGRFMAMHLENVPLRKNLDGYIGVFPFVNKAIDIAMDEGWIMFGDPITILKNQQMQAITKKVSSLTMTSMETDRSRICPAMNGYLVLFKKPGENQRRISDLARCKSCQWEGYLDQLTGFDEKSLRGYKSGDIFLFDFTCPECGSDKYESYSDMAGQSENGQWTNGDKWIMAAEGSWPEHEMFHDDFSKMAKMSQEQRFQDLLWTALGIWPDINESDVLYRGNKDQEDTDKHLCPLPRSIVKRAIELYSLPGETVFTPFAGSGTAIDQAIQLNRKVIGIELKSEYFTLSVKNAELAVKERQQLTLWDLAALEGA